MEYEYQFIVSQVDGSYISANINLPFIPEGWEYMNSGVTVTPESGSDTMYHADARAAFWILLRKEKR